MKSFERLVEDKNRVIKDCEDFIKELKDISLRTSSISALIELLLKKKDKYVNLKFDNYKESVLSIEDLDEKIYRQIVLLENNGVFRYWETKKESKRLIKQKKILQKLKSKDIKQYDDSIKELKDVNDSVVNNYFSRLIVLLENNKENNKEIIDEIDKHLKLIESKLNNRLDKFCTEYKDQQKLKFIIEKFNFIKNHYKSIITLLGLTPFIIYFVLNKNIGYIPMLESGDFFLLLVSLALAGLGMLFILYIMPILQISIVFCMRDIKGILPVFLGSVFLSGVLIVLILFEYSLVLKNSEISFVIFYIIDIFFIYISLVYFSKQKNQKINILKSEQFWLLAIHGLISMLSLFVIFLLISIRTNQRSLLDILCILLLFIILIIPLLVALVKTKDVYFFHHLFYIFIVTNLALLVILSDNIVQISDLGNIKYKYLTVEKNIKEALPKEVCDLSEITLFESKEASSYIDNNLSIEIKESNGSISKNILVFSDCLKFTDKKGNELNLEKAKKINFQNKILSYILDNNNTELKEENASVKLFKRECVTYFEKNDEVIKLHNIKALSTLGKFYYLETKDGTKFELDANKIISRQKYER